MIYILTSCTVVLGKEKDFEKTLIELMDIYKKNGATPIGFWWTIGERNEAIWITSWKDIGSFEKGQTSVLEDENYPIDKVSSMVIAQTDKILKPQTASPLK